MITKLLVNVHFCWRNSKETSLINIISKPACSLLFSLLVLALNTVSKSSFSLCSYVCIGLPGPADHPKVKYSLSACTNKGNLREYFTLGWSAGPGRPIHTYEQRENELLDTVFKANTSREQAKKHDIQLVGRPFQVLLPKLSYFQGPLQRYIKSQGKQYVSD